MIKNTKLNAHFIGILIILFGIYLVMISAPNYVGYVVMLLGIAMTLKPDAVKHLAYHHNEKRKKQTDILRRHTLSSASQKRLPKNKRNGS